ncbi:MAG: tyrosine-type recombinase/integrase [Thermoplasmata archaeon]
MLEALGRETNPEKLTADDIAILYARAPWISNHERSMVLTRLRAFLGWLGNRVMYTMPGLDLRPPQPRRAVYSLREMKAIRDAATHPYERFAVHLEQDYGCRRITVYRARVEDFDALNGTVILRIKGRGGDRTMEAPMHPATIPILGMAIQERDKVIASCREKGYSGPIPPEVMLVKWNGEPKPISLTGIDNMLIRICKRAGVKPRGHHANRRGAATVVYSSTSDLVATQLFLGHADPKTTEMYIGTGLEHQKKAQSALMRALASESSIPSN